MDAVTTAIANRIKINVQSIFKQYTKRQQSMNAKLTSMHLASTSMLRVSTASVQNINNQCVLRQQPMRISPDFLMLGFSSPNTFALRNMPPIPVILRGAEGEVAESILPGSTLSQGVWRDCPKDLSPSAREVILQLKEPFMGEGGVLAVGQGEDTIKGIFPKRPEKCKS